LAPKPAFARSWPMSTQILKRRRFAALFVFDICSPSVDLCGNGPGFKHEYGWRRYVVSDHASVARKTAMVVVCVLCERTSCVFKVACMLCLRWPCWPVACMPPRRVSMRGRRCAAIQRTTFRYARPLPPPCPLPPLPPSPPPPTPLPGDPPSRRYTAGAGGTSPHLPEPLRHLDEHFHGSPEIGTPYGT
jgi:hypothetical protein